MPCSTTMYFFQKRTGWILLTIGALILELIALYLQHIMLLKPCVLCIYQRCALFGIIASGLLISINPAYTSLKISGSLFWIYSAWKGFTFAKQQNNIQLYSSPFITCDFLVNFPSWLPLDKWIPSIFHSYGECIEHKWYFLTLEMSEWMMIIFIIYLIIPIIILSILTIDKYKNINLKR